MSEILGVSLAAVYKWTDKNFQRPDDGNMKKIVRLTKGHVMPNDFYNLD